MGYKYRNEVIKTKGSSPVTLTQAKDQCSVDEDFLEDDRILLSKINQATAYIESRTGTDIVFTENAAEYIEFDGNILCIEETPLKELKSIKKTVDGVEEELVANDDYTIQKNRTSFIIRFTETITADSLAVEFETGYDFGEIPFDLESAIIIKINDLYDMERTSYVVGTNFRRIDPIESLISSYTVNRW